MNLVIGNIKSFRLNNQKEEIEFWDDWFRTKRYLGNIGHLEKIDQWKMIFEPYEYFINFIKVDKIKILDIDEDCLTIIEKKSTNNKLEATSANAHLEGCNILLTKYNITSKITNYYFPIEELVEKFKPNSFDYAFAANFLNHTYDPLLAIKQMLLFMKEGSNFLLYHAESEPKRNINMASDHLELIIEDGELWIKSEKVNVSIQRELGSSVKISYHNFPPNLIVLSIKKNQLSVLTSEKHFEVNSQNMINEIDIISNIETILINNEIIFAYPLGRHGSFLNSCKKVTICVPLFNSSRNLERCLDSIISQTYNDIQIVIVDNNSTDSSFPIACQYAKKYENIIVYRNNKNIGRIQNWNKCLDLSNGEYIKFVMANDYLLPECVSKLVETMDSDKKIVLARSSLSVLKNDKSIHFEPLFEKSQFINGEEAIKYSLINGNIAAGPSAQIFRKKIIDEYNLSFNPEMTWASDFDFALKLLEYGNFAYLREQLFVFDSTSKRYFSNSNVVKKFEDEINVRINSVERKRERYSLVNKVLDRIRQIYNEFKYFDNSNLVSLDKYLQYSNDILSRINKQDNVASDLINSEIQKYLQLNSDPLISSKNVRKRICFVTNGIIGPTRGGGIAAWVTTLAEMLVNHNHLITIVLVRWYPPDDNTFEYWVEHYKNLGIKLVVLDCKPKITFHGINVVIATWEVYEWLKDKTFDVVHFNDYEGAGYYSLLAKHQGIAFKDTLLCVTCHSPHFYIKQASNSFINELRDLEVDFMERQSVAFADILISPSKFMIRWMKDNEWVLPQKYFVQQSLLPNYIKKNNRSIKSVGQIKELVFFGMLQDIKGLELFCDAIDRLLDENINNFTIAFLGKEGYVSKIPSKQYIQKRAQKWNLSYKIITDLLPEQAIIYLQGEHRLAILLSVLDNSPYTVMECIEASIPFIASKVGGIPELIYEDDINSVCFERNVEACVAIIRSALLNGINLARHRINREQRMISWLNWYDSLPYNIGHKYFEFPYSKLPLVTVCIPHFNRPIFLKQAIDSIKEQDYKNLELIVIDDGSTDKEAIDYISTLEKDFDLLGWRVIKQENKYLGAARNAGAHYAKGEFIAFLDDDDIAKPNRISMQVNVALHTKADIVLAGVDEFEGTDAPTKEQIPRAKWIALGPAFSVGLFSNMFGAVQALIRKDTFDILGGFQEVKKIGFEDWEFWARAVGKGFKLEMIPECLNWYRITPNSMLQTTPQYLNHMVSIKPYLEQIPLNFRHIIQTALGMHLNQIEIHKDYAYLLMQYNFDKNIISAFKNLIIGKDDEAKQIILDTIQEVLKIKEPYLTIEVMFDCGVILSRSKHYEISIQLFKKARNLAETIKSPDAINKIDLYLSFIENIISKNSILNNLTEIPNSKTALIN